MRTKLYVTARILPLSSHSTRWGQSAAIGICVGYRVNRLIRGLDENVSLIRMAYGHRPPRISTRDANEPKKAAKKILSHKKDNWVCE
jgi:hypothetical protein